MNIKFFTLLLAALAIFSFAFFIAIPGVKAVDNCCITNIECLSGLKTVCDQTDTCDASATMIDTSCPAADGEGPFEIDYVSNAGSCVEDFAECPQYHPTPATAGTGATTGTGTAGSGGGASAGGGVVALPNPLGTTDFRIIFGRLIETLTGVVGGLALLMFIYGGFHWLTSAGNPEKIKKGQDIILWAVIGIFLMFIAYFVIRYFLIGLTEGGLIPPR